MCLIISLCTLLVPLADEPPEKDKQDTTEQPASQAPLKADKDQSTKASEDSYTLEIGSEVDADGTGKEEAAPHSALSADESALAGSDKATLIATLQASSSLLTLSQNSSGSSPGMSLGQGWMVRSQRGATVYDARLSPTLAIAPREDVGSAARFERFGFTVDRSIMHAGAMTLTVGGGLTSFGTKGALARNVTQPQSMVPGSDYRDVTQIVRIPVLESTLRVDLNNQTFVQGTTTAHALQGFGTFLDFTAEAGFRISENFGLFAGYQYMSGNLGSTALNQDLDKSGPFARFQLRF